MLHSSLNYRFHSVAGNAGIAEIDWVMNMISNEFNGSTSFLCIFCKYLVDIEFDLELHLYEKHRMELVRLPIGKSSIDRRIEYSIEEGKKVVTMIQHLSKQDRMKLGFWSS